MADTKEAIQLIPRRPVGANCTMAGSAIESYSHYDEAQARRVREIIAAAAARNTELLRQLHSTADAPGQLAYNETRLSHNARRLKQQETAAESATVGSKLQHQKHKKTRDSVAKRLFYSLTRRKAQFVAKASSEEKSYLETLKTRRNHEALLVEIREERAQLEREARTLGKNAEKHGAAHKGIDELYESIFHGPTPGFRKEDVQEYRHESAKAAHEKMMEAVKGAVTGVKAAAAIAIVLTRATFEAGVAMSEAQSRLGSLNAVASRFGRCARYISRGQELSDEAIAAFPKPLSPNLHHAKATIDQLFREVIQTPTDRSDLRDNALAVASRLRGLLSGPASDAQARLLEEIKAAAETCRQGLRETARALENERQTLQQTREAAFEETVGFGAAAPAYHECCDRAESYEEEADVRCQLLVDPTVEELPPLPEYEHPPPEVGLNGRDT